MGRRSYRLCLVVPEGTALAALIALLHVRRKGGGLEGCTAFFCQLYRSLGYRHATVEVPRLVWFVRWTGSIDGFCAC